MSVDWTKPIEIPGQWVNVYRKKSDGSLVFLSSDDGTPFATEGQARMWANGEGDIRGLVYEGVAFSPAQQVTVKRGDA